MKHLKPSSVGTRKINGFFVLLLAAILTVLFWRSFLPDYIHFSNDGPLGAQNANWVKLPQAMTGQWDDLNSIGYNGGTALASFSTLLVWLLKPLGYAKFLAPIALLFLGLGVWTFLRQLKLSLLAAALGGLAVTLNSAFFADACWGTASHQIAYGMDFFALALIVSNSREAIFLLRYTRLALAGLCVGINVIEASDIGALCSIIIAGFAFFRSIVETDSTIFVRTARGIGRVTIIAAFAGFIAAQSITSLISTQIQGIAGTGQTTEAKASRWDFATQWSLPKIETLGLFVPGLFGYKMDTPNGMMPMFRDAYRNGNYWGGIGRDPANDRYFESGGKDSPPDPSWMRQTGGGDYCGILVGLIALWTIAQSFRKKDSVFTGTQKKFIWFWLVVMVVSILLAWGRFAPIFYGTLYHLPYFSTIRSPAKFITFFTWAILILFAYGIHGFSLRYFAANPSQKTLGLNAQLKNWWSRASRFDRKWMFTLIGIFIASVLGWLIYDSEKANFIQYLQKVGFGNPEMATGIADFSLGQVKWFLVLLAIAIILITLTIAGYFNGARAKLGAILLGVFLVFDLTRADLPYIIYWNYIQKYEVGTLNPVEDFLRQKPYEHRVAILPWQPQQQLRSYDNFFFGSGLYTIEWAQHHFPYYNIQSLDVIQMPRTPADLMAFNTALAFANPLRKWELTNTRYLLGAAGFLEPLNEQLDPQKKRFRIAQRFDLVIKPNLAEKTGGLDELTAVTNNDGDLALFDFTGALPRAKLYSSWRVVTANPVVLQEWIKNIQQHVPAEMGNSLAGLDTNDLATLHTLVDTNFNPAKTLLLSTPDKDFPSVSTNENSGSVEFKSYTPKKIVFDAKAAAPSILLLNDKYDPNWRVTVDGKPEKLLRCNFIMRGVYLTPGEHTVEFQFSLPDGPLYVTLSAIGLGIVLCGVLFFLTSKSRRAAAND